MSELLQQGGNPAHLSELSLGCSARHLQLEGQGQLSLIGHCLGSDREIVAATDQVQRTDNIRPLTDLHGSYSGVLQTERGITAFSDLSGQFPLYYSYADGNLRINQSSRELAGTNPVFDRVSIAAELCLNMSYLRERRTMFAGVSRLEGGTMLRYDERGMAVQVYDDLSARPEATMDIAAEMTRISLIEALQRRLELGDASCDFSGGHDSTSLAMLIALLSHQLVHCWVHYNDRYPAGDIQHARRLAKLNTHIVLHELQEGPHELPYSILSPEALALYDEPLRYMSTLGLELRRRQAIASSQAAMHVVGVGGDALYDSRPALADLVRRGEMRQAWQQATILGRLALSTPRQYMEAAVQQSSMDLPQAFAELAKLCRQPDDLTAFSVGWLARPTANIHWLAPEMRQQLAVRAEQRAHDASEYASMGDFSTMSAIRNDGSVQQHVRYLYGHASHAPFLDHKVIRAATQLDAFTRSPYEEFKPVLRKALSGHGVPQKVFERTTKGNYSPAAEAGLRQMTGAILKLLDDSPPATLEIIDPAAVRRSIEQHGLNSERYYMEPLVALKVWLQQQATHDKGSAAELSAAHIHETPVTSAMAETLSQKLAVAPETAFAAGPVQMLALNLTTGKRAVLNQTAITVLRVLNDGGNGEDAVRALTKQFPRADLSRVQSDVATAIAAGKTSGLFVDASEQFASHTLPDWPEPQLEHSPDVETFRVPLLHPTERFHFSEQDKARGKQALEQAHVLGQAGLVATISHLREIRPASVAQGAVRPVQRDKVLIRQLSLGAGHNDQRIACYESSVAAVLLAAARKQHLVWRLGVAFRPNVQLHAWVEINNKPVQISTDEQVSDVYQPLLSI